MDELKNAILLKKYKIIKRIGKGAFGSVFVGKNINKIDYVAIKLELKNQTDTILEREAYILHMLRGFGIPRVISYGHNLKYNILIQ
jgi:predicted Ser/Thr protein kinase